MLKKELQELHEIAKNLNTSNPSLSDQIMEACTLLSDPTIHLMEIPEETIKAELAFLTGRYVSTVGKNREMADKWLHTILSDNIESIKKKLRNKKIKTKKTLLYFVASTTVIRKIMCGILKHLDTLDEK